MTSIVELIKEVKAGNINPLEAYVIVKKEQQEIESAIKELQDEAINEGLKYGEKSFNAYGAKIEMRNSPSTYKFCESIKQMEERIKQIKEQSKLGEFADTESGEIIHKAIKLEGKQIISISFK